METFPIIAPIGSIGRYHGYMIFRGWLIFKLDSKLELTGALVSLFQGIPLKSEGDVGSGPAFVIVVMI